MGWFVGKKIPGVGDLAAEQLQMRGFEIYEPRIVTEEGESEYLFPSYILVKCDGSRREVVRVNSTRYMKRLLPAHLESPTQLPDGYVEYLQSYVMQHNATPEQVEEASIAYVREQKLVITCGPYAGQEGPFQFKKKGCAAILLTLLGAKREVLIPLQNVSASSGQTTTRSPRSSFAPQFRRRKPVQNPMPEASLLSILPSQVSAVPA